MDIHMMESMLVKYNIEEKVNIITALKSVHDHEFDNNSDPLYFQICLGGKIKLQNEEIKSLSESLQISKEQNFQNEKDLKDIKEQLERERSTYDDMEDELNKNEERLQEIKQLLKNKDGLIVTLDSLVEEKAEEIICLRKSTSQEVADKVTIEKKAAIQEKVINDLRDNLKKEKDLKQTKANIEIDDLKTEIIELHERIKDSEDKLRNINYEKKLIEDKFQLLEKEKNEQKNLDPRQCDACDKFFDEINDLKDHKRTEHEHNFRNEELKQKIRNMEFAISQQKLNLSNSLFELKEKEIVEKRNCQCKRFCFINHSKFNWTISRADQLNFIASTVTHT